MKFSDLSQYLQKLESISSRIEITKILAELFRDSSAIEIDKTVYLVLGRLAPAYKGIVFNLADKLVIQSLAKAFDKDVEDVQKLYKKTGDLGEVASQLAAKNHDGKLSVNDVYNKLVEIAKTGGEGSVEKKIDGFAQILKDSDSQSAKYIARIPLGKLRLGFSDLTILDALSWMETGDKTKKAVLARAYEVLPDIGLLAKEVKEKGADRAAKSIKPVLGVPIMPMLAQRIKTADEMITKMGEVSVEPKYDGLRVLIHFKKGKWIKAFTRNLNDVSLMFPELETIAKVTNSKELILDAEAVGVDEQTKKAADFQTTMQRRRKHDIAGSATKIPLVFNIFDILYKDGESLIDDNYLDRREVLNKTIKQNSSFKITPSIITTDPEVIRDEYKKYIKLGLEGIIAKKTDATYIPGRTGYRWVKVKQAEEAEGKLSDTVDCVIMGYTQGQGKRVSFGLGQFLAGVKDREKFLSITKVGTGLSDEQFKELKKRLEPIITKEMPSEYVVHKDLTPDFWVKPEVVVELAADDLTVSPKHSAGFALRFPRLVKFRDDKSPGQATTVKEVKKLYGLQN